MNLVSGDILTGRAGSSGRISYNISPNKGAGTQGTLSNVIVPLYTADRNIIINSIQLTNTTNSSVSGIILYVNGIQFVGALTIAGNENLSYTNGNWDSDDGGGGAGPAITDGDKGDVTVSGGGSSWVIDNNFPATKVADGSVSNTEFQYLSNVTSDIQGQINAIGGGSLPDGDYGDITVSGSGTVISVDNGLLVTKLADGSISNTEFQHLNGITSNIQTQLENKTDKAFVIAMSVAL